MAHIMESTRQKTFTPRWTFLSVAAVLVFILLIYTALSAATQFKVVRVADGDKVKVVNNRAAATIRLVGSQNEENYGRKKRLLGFVMEGICAVIKKWR